MSVVMRCLLKGGRRRISGEVLKEFLEEETKDAGGSLRCKLFLVEDVECGGRLE